MQSDFLIKENRKLNKKLINLYHQAISEDIIIFSASNARGKVTKAFSSWINRIYINRIYNDIRLFFSIPTINDRTILVDNLILQLLYVFLYVFFVLLQLLYV